MAEEKKDIITEETDLWKDYQNGRDYQDKMGFSKKFPMFVRFYEGDQWPASTKNTKNMPRPVVNIIKMICRNKKSAILSSPVKIVYRAEDDSVDVDKFNRFAEYIQKEIGQEALDKRAIDSGVKKGSYFYHFYWDEEAVGKSGNVEGGVREEIIDPLNIFFADPTEVDEQKQEWIIIASRENVKSVQAKCDKGIDPELIQADEWDNKYGTKEQEGDELCTVLTRYFRRDGEVWCEKSVRGTIVNAPFCLTPNKEEAKRAMGLEPDAPNNSTPDSGEGMSLIKKKRAATLYPVVVGNYEPREGSIYGLGEVEGLIPNQKAINFNLAMLLLNAQEMAWGKYLVVPNALKNQAITNEPGQVLTDWSGTGTGIKKLSESGMNNMPLELIETISSLTRVVTGSTEVMTGEILGAGMSGAAIAQLQAQAQQPVEELKDAFWLVKEKQGLVLAQFFKLYYDQKEFSYIPEDEAANEKPKRTTDIFSASEYENVEFSVVVEATAGTKASAAGDINTLETLFNSGHISLKTFLRSYPRDALSNRTEILRGIEADEQDQMKTIMAQMQQLQEQNAQLIAEAKESADAVEKAVSLIEENEKLKQSVVILGEQNSKLRDATRAIYEEAAQKIAFANSQIAAGNAKLDETTADATEFAEVIAKEHGMMPQPEQQVISREG